MNNQQDNNFNSMASMFLTLSMSVLILDFYYYNYFAFREWKLTWPVSDRILYNIIKMGLFKNMQYTRLITLGLFTATLLTDRARKDGRIGYSRALIYLAIGLLLFFGSETVLYSPHDVKTIAEVYMSSALMGYLFIMAGAHRLTRMVWQPGRGDAFADNLSGFRQEEKLIRTEYSLNFPTKYELNGRTRKSWINVINPRRGVLIVGSPGAGKSWYIIEPAIQQLTEKGMSLFVYDFKFPALTNIAFNSFKENQHKYPPTTRFCSINFTDLGTSSRCNLIDPATLEFNSDALGVSRTILTSLNKSWVHKEGDFFIESPINFLAALIWYLRTYENGRYCTLPHVIELSATPYEELFTLLNAEPTTRAMADSFIRAFKNNTVEMLDGQLSSAKVPLTRLASPDIYYILTGNDLALDINNPSAPVILCLGGVPARKEALGPVFSLYIDRLNSLINRPGKHPCALVLDEFATVRAPSVLATLATARSNNVVTILSIQDLSQLKTMYSKDEADQVMNITGTIICGQVGGETAQRMSEKFQSETQYRTTVSVNSRDTSVSKTEHSAGVMSPAIIAHLSSGEFVGVLTDDPDKKLKLKAFHASFQKRPTPILKDIVLPQVHQVDDRVIKENFVKVREEIKELVKSEMKRIIADPSLKSLIVKK